MVPFTLLFLADGEKIYGALGIRHRLSGRLAEYGGHIGYGVAPLHRRKGYGALTAKKQCRIYNLRA